MIKYFRRIRSESLETRQEALDQKLLAENRIAKYLFYAIGEIALVMIGILLALQVNNWNENRKDLMAKEEAVRDLHEEFMMVKENFEKHIEFLNQTHDDWDSYLKKITAPGVLKSNNLDYRPRSAFRKFSPKNSTLISIFSTGKIDRIGNKDLKNALTGWQAFFDNFKSIQEVHEEFCINELLYTERKFLALHSRNKYQFPDFNKMENLKIALSDRHYQNLLLSLFDLLKLKISAADPVLNEIEKIISLLEKEISL